MQKKIEAVMSSAEKKAWNALAGYKFWMFGYYAARWVSLNALLDKPLHNPFAATVKLAREKTNSKPRTEVTEPHLFSADDQKGG
jgi:hypothetical protein